jgi:hypothetical protein
MFLVTPISFVVFSAVAHAKEMPIDLTHCFSGTVTVISASKELTVLTHDLKASTGAIMTTRYWIVPPVIAAGRRVLQLAWLRFTGIASSWMPTETFSSLIILG